MLRIILLLACLGLLLPLTAAPWVGHQTAGVVLFTRDGQERLAQRLLPMVEEEVPRVAAELGLATVRPFAIMAYSSRVDFLRATGRQPNLLGQSLSSTGEIQLDATGSDEDIRPVLAHELTHSLLNQRLGDNLFMLPAWVNEGIAGHLSEPVSPRQMAGVARMIHRDGPLTLAELDNAFSSGDYRDAAYLQSRAMVAWLESRQPGTLLRLLDEVERGELFGDALSTVAGLTIEEWLNGWQRQVPALLFWLPFLSSPAAYSPFAFILVWVAVRRILRKRKEEAEAAAAGEIGEDEVDFVEEEDNAG